MSICYRDHKLGGLQSEERLLSDVTVRLIDPLDSSERGRHDHLMEQEHYLGNSNAIGQVLRYVAEYQGQWVAALTFCSAALHLKPRDQLLKWSAREVTQRRHLIAQNSRFLILASTGHWPNLASRVLKLIYDRLPADWQEHFGHPVLLAETFVDPQRFQGTCYKAAGWQALGQTQGYERRGQDYYVDTQHPKELWVRPLFGGALEQLQAEQLPANLQADLKPLPPELPVDTADFDSLWDFVRARLIDHRRPKGVRYPIASVVCMAAVAIGAGCRGTHAIAEFVQTLNHGQRRRLRCPRVRGAKHQFKVPCERTFIRLLQKIDSDQLRQIFSDWMAQMDPEPLKVIHLDGKVLRNAHSAPPAMEKDSSLAQAAALIDTPQEQQKPKAEKALTLVNFQTPNQRLIDQIVVPRDTNEEAAVAAHLPKMDLCGVTIIGDAAHTVKANCHHITQEQGAEYVFFLKGNQPTAFAKAKQLLLGDFPPSGSNPG